ncbi:hypothetical protein [Hymenobacter sp. B1770]|uniref:hypothetical protein n=1 Tax=Hymenobacter sp. B1770 TaxID=1718788 RepID=UPI003CF8D19C
MGKSSFYKRVSKYNPRFRNEQGHYLPEEWCCFSGIGQEFAGRRLHLDEYLAVERRYVQAARLFFAGSVQVALESVEVHWAGELDEALAAVYRQVEHGVRSFPVAALDALVQLALREALWYRLVDDTRTRALEFGYDFYLLLGFEVPDPECFRQIEYLPLFVE